ncbi:signal peptidase II [Acidimangrovimonas sediminis]|uniref:signal peptidase II n=1 Tax=Acidimangrovimonas sediminis TaxID=2056283 RepID=UPI000C7FE7E7|nr:signal peptidase II [Acidimangrovimonas sediminis]
MRLTYITALTIIAVDQISKLVVVHMMGLATRGSIDVVPPYLNFRMAWNEGVNFGLFANSAEVMRWLLVVVALAISLWVWAWIRRTGHSALARISAGLLIGGAVGNVIDRLAYGAVADFLNMSCCGYDNPFSFNLADVAIFAGALGLVAFGGQKTP